MSDTTLPRLLLAGDPSLAAHLDAHGELPSLTRSDRDGFVETVARAGLRGHGGAGFPTAVKLRSVRDGRGRPIVVANGAEGEPISAKDRVLLEHAPHLVLDGATLAAQAVGANEALVCVPSTSAPALDSVTQAIAERERSRRPPVRLGIRAIPDGYLAGEETALVNHLNGGPLKPTLVRPFARGVDRRPTLVNNVETLAQLALIARHGDRWFRAIGTIDDPGSRLVTISGAVPELRVFEIPGGTHVKTVVDAAGGLTADVGAILVGGYFGTWLPGSAIARTTLDVAGLAPYGATLGAGAIVLLPAADCGVVATARIVGYLAGETAGQCGPCAQGLPAIAGALDRLARARGDGHDLARVVRWSAQVRGRGACHHPDGVVRLVASALDTFADEIELHRHGRCSAVGAPDPSSGPMAALVA
jgi:NADH:ubiquinone oxidoreductase subunit F (NADH-binding)